MSVKRTVATIERFLVSRFGVIYSRRMYAARTVLPTRAFGVLSAGFRRVFHASPHHCCRRTTGAIVGPRKNVAARERKYGSRNLEPPRPPRDSGSTASKGGRTMKRRSVHLLGILALVGAVGISTTAAAAPAEVQRVHVGWHAQSGNVPFSAVADDAT